MVLQRLCTTVSHAFTLMTHSFNDLGEKNICHLTTLGLIGRRNTRHINISGLFHIISETGRMLVGFSTFHFE